MMISHLPGCSKLLLHSLSLDITSGPGSCGPVVPSVHESGILQELLNLCILAKYVATYCSGTKKYEYTSEKLTCVNIGMEKESSDLCL